MQGATRLQAYTWKQIQQQQPDPNLVSKLIWKTQSKPKQFITAMERLFLYSSTFVVPLTGDDTFWRRMGETSESLNKHKQLNTIQKSTADSLRIFSSQDRRAQEHHRIGWGDTNDQDGRTQLISDTEMFNGVKVLL